MAEMCYSGGYCDPDCGYFKGKDEKSAKCLLANEDGVDLIYDETIVENSPSNFKRSTACMPA